MQPSFVPYLTLNDYLLQIRSGQLNNQLLDAVEEGGEFERQEAESFAIDEVRSLLSSYFYLDFEFRDTLPFDWFKKYYVGDRITIDFPAWIAASAEVGNIQDESSVNTYIVGDCVVYNQGLASKGNINKWFGYVCKNPNSDQVWTENNWIEIGNQYDIFFVKPPYDIFQLKPGIQIGTNQTGLYKSMVSKVCWDNKIWLCRNSSRFVNHQATEQYYEVNDIPSPNIFPNQITGSAYTDGNYQWIDKGEFFLKSVPPVKLVGSDLNTGVDAWTDQYRKNWTFGDNRSNTMKQIVIAIAISKLMGRNSFQLRERSIQRDWAYRKLKEIKNGEVTTLIPIIQPDQDLGIAWGGAPRIINTF